MEKRNALHSEIFEYHKLKGFSITDTAKHFKVCPTTVKKWVARVARGEVLEKSRKPNNRRLVNELSPQVLKEITQDLMKWNRSSSRIRNVIAPTYTKFAVDSDLYKGSYSSFQKFASSILGSIPRRIKERKKKNPAKLSWRNKDTSELTQNQRRILISSKSKKTRRANRITETWKALSQASGSKGWWQVDMAYFYPSYYDSKDLYQDYIKRQYLSVKVLYENNIRAYSTDEPDLRNFCEAVKAECLDDYNSYVDEIRNIEEFIPKLYQYTAVNPITQKVVRMVAEHHDAQSAKTFLFKIEKESGEKVEFAQTDNGTDFVAGSTFLSRLRHPDRITFHSYLEKNRRVHIKNPKGCPWMNGFVESQHRLDRERLYNNNFFTSLSDVENKMVKYEKVHIMKVSSYRLQHRKSA